MAEVEDLNRYGSIYKEFVERHTDSPLSRFSQRLYLWDVTTANPFVLRLWASLLDQSEKAEALGMLASFIVRRAVCGLTTKNYNNLFLSLISHLDKSTWSARSVAAFLLDQKSESGRFPRDPEFTSAMESSPLYRTIGPTKTRALLMEFEQSRRTKFQEIKSLPTDLTVEHVMPRSWQANWPLADGSRPSSTDIAQADYVQQEDGSPLGIIARRQRLKDTIGNLTLVTPSFNSSLSNESFNVKKDEFLDQAVLMITRDVTKQNAWREDEIIKRGCELASSACSVWPIPSM